MANQQIFANNAITSLAAPLSAVATTMTVFAPNMFPSPTAGDWFVATLQNFGVVEIVKVTAVAGTLWTIQRAQEGTAAQSWTIGTSIQMRVTKGTLEYLRDFSGATILGQLADTTNPTQGDALLGVKKTYTGTIARTQHAVNNDVVFLEDFDTPANLAINATPAVQAAVASGASRIYCLAKDYVCTTAWNLTNLAATGARISFIGAGMSYDSGGPLSGTTFHMRTGNGGWMVDCTGSQFLYFREMRFVADGGPGVASTNGFLFARSTVVAFAQNNEMYNVLVRLPTYGPGSLALANDCAEQFMCQGCWFEADTPFIATLANEMGWVSPYAIIAHPTYSNTDLTFLNCTFTPISSTAMILQGIGTGRFYNCVWIPVAPHSSYPYAITLRSSIQGYKDCMNIEFSGQVERFDTAYRFDGNTTGITVETSNSDITVSHLSVFSGTVHNNLKMQPVPLANNLSTPLVVPVGAGVVFNGGELVIPPTSKINSTNLTLAGTVVDGGGNDLSNPLNFTVNPLSSYDIRWVNDNARYAVSGAVNVNTGTAVVVNFAASGVRVTDAVLAFPPYNMQGLVFSPYVSATNQISVSIANLTGVNLNLGFGTWRFLTTRPTF